MTKTPKIYGIAGKKGSGKDTFAKLIAGTGNNFRIEHFADSLKAMVCTIFNLDPEQLTDPVAKETAFTTPIIMDSFLPIARWVTRLPLEGRGKLARTPRELAQYLGTEYVRSINQSYWVDTLLNGPLEGGVLLVPDTRFPNEADAIRKKGGKIIKIIRIDAPQNQDPHQSESALDEYSPDLVLGIRTGDLAVPKRVAELIKNDRFEYAMRYDYRRVLDFFANRLIDEVVVLEYYRGLDSPHRAS